jgi:hypothetical protein
VNDAQWTLVNSVTCPLTFGPSSALNRIIHFGLIRSTWRRPASTELGSGVQNKNKLEFACVVF